MTAAAAAATAPTTDHVLIASLCPPHLWWRVPFLCTPLPPAPRPRNHFRAMREALGVLGHQVSVTRVIGVPLMAAWMRSVL